MTRWKTALELNSAREVLSGSPTPLVDAIRRGADLRIATEFVHNQHIDITSDCDDRILEVAEFGVTYLVGDQWAAGVMSLRQPIELPHGFGPRPSMSFFLYNQNGQQAIARPFLDSAAPTAQSAAFVPRHSDTPLDCDEGRFHQQSSFDAGTNAPCSNFIYDFDVYRFSVSDSWREVLSHDAMGNVLAGSLGELVEAFSAGCELKVGVRGLCSDLTSDPGEEVDHEVFIQVGPGYYYIQSRLFIAGSHPLVRVCPAIPMLYRSHGWDFGWLLLRTDGQVVYRRCDPYTLRFEDTAARHAVRWFAR